MKTTFLLAALLGCAALGHAQTTPSPATGSAAPSGTKNVGADRADAPQAPGMQASSTTPVPAGHTSKASGRRSAKKAASRPMAPQP